ncbi:ABC transporter permease [uncultured Slackia sp.]|uniref:ABC transporter permease n=1 Tax=uncultured Slackia sp. TaxID=665903 RepID=UPI0025E5213C|nr:ABC transporter permease [uncultured Slackia sp.]
MLAKLAAANVRKSARDFAVYFFTLVLGIAVFYAFNSIADSQAVARIGEDGRKMMELLAFVINAVSVFIVVILAFLVVYANRFLIRRRNKEFALYLTLGMQKGDLLKVSALETLFIGIASLAVGLAIGLALSQVLCNVAASMFDSEVEGVAFSVSVDAIVLTVVAFAAIFLVTVVFNTGHLFKSKLIDLLNADRRNESFKLRSLPLSFVLFIVACVLIGVSYKLLMDNGLLEPSPEFMAATVLVCVGTVLFFYSVSGFLLRVTQMIKPLYLRGLNMFFLRQLSARANSAFVSMSVIALTLFLAMTSVCGGIGIVNAMNASAANGTKYDASVVSTYAMWNYDTGELEPMELGEFGAFAESHGYNMVEGLAASTAAVDAPSWDDMVKGAAQVDFRLSGVSLGDLNDATGKSIYDFVGSGMLSDGMDEQQLDCVSVSQFNTVRELANLEPIDLGESEFAIWNDAALTSDYAEAIAAAAPSLNINGHDLTALRDVQDVTLETTGVTQRICVLVVPDECIDESVMPWTSLLDVQCNDGQEEAFQSFLHAVQESSNPDTYPVSLIQTVSEVEAQSSGFTAVVSYLAIYIGFVLVIACAAILAIQQLTDAADSVRRYELIAKLGAPQRMIDGALFKLIGIYFLFPLLVGIAHTLCAMQVVIDVVQVFGYLDIGSMSVVTMVAFLVVYGAYFLVTYVTARNMVKFKRA